MNKVPMLANCIATSTAVVLAKLDFFLLVFFFFKFLPRKTLFAHLKWPWEEYQQEEEEEGLNINDKDRPSLVCIWIWAATTIASLSSMTSVKLPKATRRSIVYYVCIVTWAWGMMVCKSLSVKFNPSQYSWHIDNLNNLKTEIEWIIYCFNCWWNHSAPDYCSALFRANFETRQLLDFSI